MDQALNDLVVIHNCYLNAKDKDSLAWAVCGQQATALRLISTFLTFMARPALEAVPRSRDEIVEGLLKFGIKAELFRYGVSEISGVITSGQLATAELARAGMDAASKPPLIIEPTIINAPGGASVIPLPSN